VKLNRSLLFLFVRSFLGIRSGFWLQQFGQLGARRQQVHKLQRINGSLRWGV
jgi:hypothetical protein